jgi:hypothetical protein
MSRVQAPLPDLQRCQLDPEYLSDKSAPPDDPSEPKSPAEPRIAAIASEFNDDVACALRNMATAVRHSRTTLIPEHEEAALPARARAVLDRFAVADALALYYRNQTRNTFVGLLVAAFFAMLLFELFAHVVPEFFPPGAPQRLVIWLYPVFWVAAWFLWFHAHRRKYQRKFHDYRALTEGLRVQLFWNLLGLPEAVEDYYLRKQQGELDWIRRALRWWRRRDEKAIENPPASAGQLTAHKALVRRCWVQDQFHYFAEVARPREERNALRYKRWGALLFWASMLLALGIGAWELFDVIQASGAAAAPSEVHASLPHGEIALIVAIGMLLVGAAVLVAYGEKMAFSEHTRQYGATSLLFRQADSALTDGPLTPAEVDLFRNLGREVLQENGDWLLLHRDRPLEMIVP